MAAAAERHYLDTLGLDPSRLTGLATTRHGHGVPTRRIRVVEAGHPVPDEAGLKAADDTLRLAAEATADDLLQPSKKLCEEGCPTPSSRPTTRFPPRRS